ncbi:MAG TPA: amidohydrolase family protein [Frankiaceae bacterium]|nr:amidohydrolase family protein [Frankiaceae bacterium]
MIWQQLGLPGLADVHVHFLPHTVMRKVWAFFDSASENYGREWPIEYRLSEPERLQILRDLGVRGFPALVYPHKAGMADWLSTWALDFADGQPDVVPTATFFPEPDAGGYVVRALERGARIFKGHLQVGGYDPRDPYLDPVWGSLADAQTPVVLHCGDGPIPGPFTGIGPISEVLQRHPTLRLVVAHLGMPRYDDFLGLADAYESVALDTTMAFTDFAEVNAPFPESSRPLLRDLGLAGKVLLGSDFPNIPHPYEHQIEALVRLDLGDDWLRQVLWHAPAAVLGLA